MVKEVFGRITIDGKDFVDIEPKLEYAPLFATIATRQQVEYREVDSTLTPPNNNLGYSGYVIEPFID